MQHEHTHKKKTHTAAAENTTRITRSEALNFE